jgi:hypothetical protein
MPLFEDNKVYRTNDIEGPCKLCPNPATRKSWTQDFDFPPGRLMGRLRCWFGWELNTWIDSRPISPMRMPKGFGGAQPRAGRRKQPEQSVA